MIGFIAGFVCGILIIPLANYLLDEFFASIYRKLYNKEHTYD